VEFAPDGVERDETGRLRTDDDMQTNMPGISAIGAARSGYAGTLIDAVAEARRAAAAISARLRAS
jgi:thioredoxin reductase